jgi:branched-chain amino acid transport system substrate-binding protein
MHRSNSKGRAGLARWWWLLLTLVAVFALVATAACGGEEEEAGKTPAAGTPAAETPVVEVTPPSPEAPLKIGVLATFTGDLGQFGEGISRGAELAVKEINAAGGVLGEPIELATGDTATEASQGVSEATRLINVEGVHAIVGAFASGVTAAVAESVTGPNSILQISPASTSDALTIAKDNDFLFRTTIHDTAQAAVLASLAQEEGISSICNMYINNSYGQGLSDRFAEDFENLGGTVTAKVPHESEQASYASELEQCGDAEAIAALSYPESAGVFLREAVEAGKITRFLFVDGTKAPEMFAKLGWDVFDGMKGTAPGGILESPTGAEFDAAYEAEYGERPPLPFMREAYDAVYVIALAAEKAGSTDPTAMRDALRDIANPPGETVVPGTEGFTAALELIKAGEDINYEGAANSCDFDENGDIPIGGIEVWRVDAASEDLVTERTFRVDLTGETPVVTEEQ